MAVIMDYIRDWLGRELCTMDRGVVDTGEPGAEGAPRLLLMRRMSSAAVGEMRRAASPVNGSSGMVSSDGFFCELFESLGAHGANAA